MLLSLTELKNAGVLSLRASMRLISSITSLGTTFSSVHAKH